MPDLVYTMRRDTARACLMRKLTDLFSTFTDPLQKCMKIALQWHFCTTESCSHGLRGTAPTCSKLLQTDYYTGWRKSLRQPAVRRDFPAR